jgi:hypothetical protein
MLSKNEGLDWAGVKRIRDGQHLVNCGGLFMGLIHSPQCPDPTGARCCNRKKNNF